MQPKKQPPDGVERAPAIQHLVSISQNAQSQGNAIFLATGQVLTFQHHSAFKWSKFIKSTWSGRFGAIGSEEDRSVALGWIFWNPESQQKRPDQGAFVKSRARLVMDFSSCSTSISNACLP